MAVLTAIAIGLGAASVYSQRQAAKAQEKSMKAQQRQADIANARERRAAIRNARVMTASVESQGAVTGTSGSSGVAGSLSNIGSRMGENLGFLGQNQQLAMQASNANMEAAKWASRSEMFSTASGLATQAGKLYTGDTPKAAGVNFRTKGQ